MPTKHYTRTWCNSCKDFTLHHTPFGLEFQCKECGDTSKTFLISDIPKEKYVEQIQRWKKSKSDRIGAIYGSFLNPRTSFWDEKSEIIITEDDLGYEKIRYENRAKEKAERQLKIEERDNLKAKYSGLTRNDKCGCGSGLKFKNCCLPKINEIIK